MTSFSHAGDDQFQSLLDTVERLRRDKFPTLDAKVVREILRLHADGGAGDSELTRGVEQAVERCLETGV
ncbi:hypothetical protein AWB76_04842 [Caballeronia temeraria]|uniref:Uncharacterized protein n=1 Tax=Caballeronia temeraria TaxID=1777137 RepID=A0A158BYF7_9BURK|nr:hypothetical protein [Caballeronia temeraria]SAK75020.1 hypothetical protein AWB76_04842 [Caballeronia temeraria]